MTITTYREIFIQPSDRKRGIWTGGIQEIRDLDWRDTGLEGYRTGGIQESRDSGLEGFGTGGMEESRDSGLDGYRNGGIWDWRELGLE